MRKKEIVIVILVIAFGIIYNISESEGFKGLFQGNWGNKSLRDKDHPVSFPQEQFRIPADEMDVTALKIDNPAGIIEVKKSNDGSIIIEPEIRVYHKDKKKAEKLLKKYAVNIKKTEAGTLRVTCRADGHSSLRRARFIITCQIPENIQLRLINAMGDVSVNDAGKKIYIRQAHGELFVKNIQSDVTAKSAHSNVRIYDVSESVDLTANHAPSKVRNTPYLKLKSSHSKVIIKGISQRLSVKRAYYSTLEIEDANDVSIPKAKHTKMQMTNIKNGVTIKRNSHAPITLTQVEGDVYVTGSNCQIQMDHITADNLTLRNKHNDSILNHITVKNLKAKTEHGDVSLDLLPGTEAVTIKSDYSTINVNYRKPLNPTLSIQANSGKIVDETDNKYDIQYNSPDYFIKKSGDGPRISVTTDFGTIKLSDRVNPFTIKAETETFEETDQDETTEPEKAEPQTDKETKPEAPKAQEKKEDKKEDKKESKKDSDEDKEKKKEDDPK